MKRLLPLLLLAVVACERAEPIARATDDGDRARALLLERDEKEVIATLAAVREVAAKAQSVELYRVAQPFDADYQQIRKTAKQTIAGYPVLKQVSLSRAEAAPLIHLLAARETYFPPGQAWTCIFEPHHVLVLAADGKTVTIVICVECGDIQFFTGGEEAAAMKSVRPEANGQLSKLLDSLIRV